MVTPLHENCVTIAARRSASLAHRWRAAALPVIELLCGL